MQQPVIAAPPRYVSPKRKRECLDDSTTTFFPSPLRLRTDLPSRSFDPDLIGGGSPRTEVAGRFSALNIRLEEPIPKLDFGAANRTKADSKRTLSTDLVKSSSDDSLIERSDTTSSEPPTLSSESGTATREKCLTTSSQSKLLVLPLALEIPETPHPHPIRLKSPPPLQLTTTGTITTPPRAKSPPLYSTSFSPDSSPEDLTGINGIGFRPTPAQAYARAQRRKQQVAEWKSREAKEARQRRSERRAGTERKEIAGVERQEEVGRKVRFVEG